MPVTSAWRLLLGDTRLRDPGVAVRLVAVDAAHATVIGHLAGLHPIDHLVEIGPQVLAERVTHLARPARDRARIALVEVAEARRIGHVVEARVLRALDREAGDQLAQRRLAAART